MPFEQLDVKALQRNVFEMIGDQWMLVTAGNGEKFNTMTASWGSMGVLWGRPIATIYIRPQRYTYEFIEGSDYFTMSFLPEEYRKAVALCGAKSGRDTDKIRETGLTPVHMAENQVYFEEAQLVLVCKKIYYQDIDPTHFLDAKIEGNYSAGDYHRAYIGEIAEVLINKRAKA